MDDNQELEQHLTTEELLDYLDKRLSSDDIVRVEAHLAHDCSSCQEELAWLTRTLELMAPSVWLDAPVRLQASVRQSYRERFAQRRESFSLGRWLQSFFTPARPLVYAAAGVLLVVIVFGLLLRPRSGASVGNAAEIAAYTGSVEVQSADDDVWQAADEAGPINVGGGVRTGSDSSVVLSFPDKSKTLLAPHTELSVLAMSLDEKKGDDRVIILEQQSGRTQNYVQPLPSAGSRFEIHTPSATVSVRGTSFTVDVETNGTTRVSVAEGRVQVAAQGVTVTLDAGEGTMVEAGHSPVVAEPMPTVPIPTELATLIPTPAKEPTGESSAEARPTPTPQPTETPTATPSATPSPTVTVVTPTPTSTPTSGSNNVWTPVPVATDTPTPIGTATLPATNTPDIPPTYTPTPTKKIPPGHDPSRTPGPPTRAPGQEKKQ
jgi:anti-sigma factor RsiW